MSCKSYSIRLDQELYNQVTKSLEELNIAPSQLVNFLLGKYIVEYTQKNTGCSNITLSFSHDFSLRELELVLWQMKIDQMSYDNLKVFISDINDPDASAALGILDNSDREKLYTHAMHRLEKHLEHLRRREHLKYVSKPSPLKTYIHEHEKEGDSYDS